MPIPKPNVLLIVTQDTKEIEGRFLRQCLEESGCTVHHLDPSVRRTIGGAEIGPEAVAAATGTTIEDIRAIGHEGHIQTVMIEGATKLALELHARVGLSGILSIGGSMGTTLGTAVMRAFPYGIPKMMISTLAAGFTTPFVGVKDITMVNAVCDVAGLNSITKPLYRQAAAGLGGMARVVGADATEQRPLVLVSTLGTTELAARRVRETLEADGYEVMVFHTTGAGGTTLDTLASERDVAAIVDLSLVEINDYLNDGVCSAGPDRGMAGLQRGIPTILAPGNCDFFILPTPMASGDSPFDGRRFHIHNAALTAVRTTEADLERLGDHLATMLAGAKGPVGFVVPLHGFSSHDSPAGHIHDPGLPPRFADYCERILPDHVAFERIDSHINDPAFGDALTDAVRAMTKAARDA